MKYEDRSFLDEPVELDGNEFVNCDFTGCRLLFGAQAPVVLDGCSFVNCEWVFDGAANLALDFLQAIYHGLGQSGEELVGVVFQQIRAGTLGDPVPASAKAVA